MAQRNTARGFTLVELLVVVAITALLTALLLPVIGRVREKGRQAVCQSNLKQIAAAMQQYVQDSDGNFPIFDDWDKKLLPYTKSAQIFQCPTDPNPASVAANDYWLNLHLNMFEFGGHQVLPRHEATVADPALTFLSGDMTGGTQITQSSCGTSESNIRHFNGANYAFVDGHVKWLNFQEAAEMTCKAMSN